MQLPHFKYHPNPIATGSVEESDETCLCCQQKRGFIYMGPAYSEEDLDDCLCPWCIADGSAHKKLNADFTGGFCGDDVDIDLVPQSTISEIMYRTPSFSSWQSELWWLHCNDATKFLGPAGYKELENLGGEALTFFRELLSRETDITGSELEEWLEGFHKDSGPTAYVFRCLHCNKIGGYWDCH